MESSLEEVARDYNPNWTTAVEIMDDERLDIDRQTDIWWGRGIELVIIKLIEI